LLEQLDPREKHILTLRFFRGMTQSQIATEIGVSQMHVSRLLSQILAQLRERLSDESLGLGEGVDGRGVEDPGNHDH